MRGMCSSMPNRRYPYRSKDKESVHSISSGLSDMSPVQDVLSCRCNNYFAGENYSGSGFLGVKMRTFIQNNFFRQSILVFTVIPLVLICAMSNFPERSLLKESLSLITILAFFQLIGQFFWARTNRSAVRGLTMSRVLKYHKYIGYTFVTVMIFHPLYIVIPRFFEAGVSPVDALITMITTMNTGVVLGMTSWCVMLVLGITSLIRNKLPMNYKSWRILHGCLAILFTSTAVWHAIDLGRHSNFAMSILLSAMTAGGILLLLKTYFFKNKIQNQ